MRVDHVLAIAVVLLELLVADFALKPRVRFIVCVSNFQMFFETPFPSELFPAMLALEGCRVPLEFLGVHSFYVSLFDGVGSASVAAIVAAEGSWICSMRGFVRSEQRLVLASFPTNRASESATKCFCMGVLGMIPQKNF